MICSLSIIAALAFQLNPSRSTPITSITLERTYCFGTCPVYTVTFKPDGTITYRGIANVPRKGIYTARFWKYDFDRLADSIKSLKFDKLEPLYRSNVTDQSSAITTVRRGGKSKVVEDNGENGPPTLWLLDEAIDGMLAEATDWHFVRLLKNDN